MEVVAADIGGTHARFAIAEVDGGRVVALGSEVTMKVIEHASLQLAWRAYATALGRRLPRAAAIAVAGPVGGDVLKLTNNPWIIRPALIPEKLEVDDFTLCNDFVAVGHTVASLGESGLAHLCGPDRPLSATGVVSIVGPGTGLGVALLIGSGNSYHVIDTEGGHPDFAPLDSIEDSLLRRLRARHNRVSVERVVAGPGLSAIYKTLAEIEGVTTADLTDQALWTAALAGHDPLAAAALDRFCLSLGAVAGDIALTQGGFGGVVIAGGIGLRLAGHLPRSGFRQRFVAKGRFEPLMASIPVKLLTYAQPGLYGAAAAFAHNRLEDVRLRQSLD
ncbi:glucokinase [Polymorphobacter sp. PAMC 29334]|uniref:glucokinase n=1 Tax=Polymorphobacter sp. PAMC 29334 TaxID=2862331 RepID=UPI001C75725A|nr:glucokinase [Polymorphobacter sp. PAMC 29334]QYE35658.1 glucokinase [Polymorphobacter sp. PAMC 29334]